MHSDMMKRFWSKVRKTRGCWLWLAATSKGYGYFFLDGKNHPAPRVRWFLYYGSWPKQQILHTCDNPLCVKIDHLRDGSRSQNMRDAAAKGRWRKLGKHQVAAIRGSKLPSRDLAKFYGVHEQTIYQLRARITHKEEMLP